MKFRFPGLKILDRYIIGKFLSTYVFAIAMIIVIVVIFDYVEKADNFLQYKAPMKEIIFDYYLNFIPFFVNQFSGLFTFIAVIFFTSRLAYQTEIIAILSAGVSFKRLMWPYFVGALIISAFSLTLNLWIIPISQRKVVSFEQMYLKKRQNNQFDKHIYRQVEPGLYLYLRSYSGEGKAAFFVLEQYEDGSMTSSLEAASATLDFETSRWKAPRYTQRKFDENSVEVYTQHRNLDTLINIDRSELGRVNEIVKAMNIDELNEFLDQQRMKGSDMINFIEVERHARYAYPFSTFILTLIGVSLSSRKVRGGTGAHIGVGVTLCFTYILCSRFFEEFARGGSLDAGLAVWAPNIIFLVVSIYLYFKAPK